MTAFCNRAEKNELYWHYSQQRPFGGFGVDPAKRHVNDCSGYVSLVFHWAMSEAEVYMTDPLGYKYSGYGYTGSMLDWLSKHGKRVNEVNGYLVGDIAITGRSAGTTNHTTICKKAGTATTSRWSSHGNENAPDAVTLHYHPTPVLGVWRHPALL
jgi:hypothetical protein